MWTQTYLQDLSGRSSRAQTQISTSGSSLGLFSYNIGNARQLLVTMIVVAELPFFFLLKMNFLKNTSKTPYVHNLEIFLEILLEMMLLGFG